MMALSMAPAGALLAVIGFTAASAYFHWGEKGVDVVGNVPSGLPHLGVPHIAYSGVMMVLPISFSCFIVILAQSAATSRAYALRYRDQFNQIKRLFLETSDRSPQSRRRNGL